MQPVHARHSTSIQLLCWEVFEGPGRSDASLGAVRQEAERDSVALVREARNSKCRSDLPGLDVLLKPMTVFRFSPDVSVVEKVSGRRHRGAEDFDELTWCAPGLALRPGRRLLQLISADTRTAQGSCCGVICAYPRVGLEYAGLV